MKTITIQSLGSKKTAVTSSNKVHFQKASVFHLSHNEIDPLPPPEVSTVPEIDGTCMNEKPNTCRQNGISDMWDNFRDNTTMHGLKNASHKQKYRIRCTVWVIALLCMGGFLSWTAVTLFLTYSEYPTITNTKVEMVSKLAFPAVTICSASPYKKDKLPSLPYFDYYLLTQSAIGPFFPAFDYSHSSMAVYNMTGNETFLEDSSNTIKDLFSFCLFDGETEDCEKVLSPATTEMGICFTYNSRNYVKKHGHLTTSRTGSTSSLRLYLISDQDNYVYNNNWAAGMKVVIHDQEEEPDVVDRGFMISPGFSTYAAIQTKKYKYLPSPYRVSGDQYCIDTKSSGFKNPLKYYSPYTRTSCKMECRRNYVVKKCGCRAHTDRGNESICSFQRLAECYRKENFKYEQNDTAHAECNCRMECEFTQYTAQISHGYYPSKVYKPILRMVGLHDLRSQRHFCQYSYDANCCEVVIVKVTEMRSVLLCTPYHRNQRSDRIDTGDTYIELNIYFESLSYMTIEHIAEYSFDDIVGILGGQMGIFLGASLLTITELLEFIFLSSVVLSKRMLDKISNQLR